ncbi:hypothetical protein H4R35_002679 [Dimargaris xerosporica]|nr:hypothetical protein H4R35_002679 [Dimargaris xerosporica]
MKKLSTSDDWDYVQDVQAATLLVGFDSLYPVLRHHLDYFLNHQLGSIKGQTALYPETTELYASLSDTDLRQRFPLLYLVKQKQSTVPVFVLQQLIDLALEERPIASPALTSQSLTLLAAYQEASNSPNFHLLYQFAVHHVAWLLVNAALAENDLWLLEEVWHMLDRRFSQTPHLYRLSLLLLLQFNLSNGVNLLSTWKHKLDLVVIQEVVTCARVLEVESTYRILAQRWADFALIGPPPSSVDCLMTFQLPKETALPLTQENFFAIPLVAANEP